MSNFCIFANLMGKKQFLCILCIFLVVSEVKYLFVYWCKSQLYLLSCELSAHIIYQFFDWYIICIFTHLLPQTHKMSVSYTALPSTVFPLYPSFLREKFSLHVSIVFLQSSELKKSLPGLYK